MARPLLYVSFLTVLSSTFLCAAYSFHKSRVLGWDGFETLIVTVEQWLEVYAPCLSSLRDFAPVLFDKLSLLAEQFQALDKFDVLDFPERCIFALVGNYTTHVFLALAICSACIFALLCSLFHSKNSVHVAISCVEEACSVLFSLKTLLLLPLLQVGAWCAVTVAFILLTLQVLSTVPVVPSSVLLYGFEVRGFARQVYPTFTHWLQFFLWSFALLWAQEMIHVMVHFAASYAAVQWVVAPFKVPEKKKKLPYFVVSKGFLIATVFHLGSLALVALLSVSARALRWTWYFLRRKKTHSSLDGCLKITESFIHYISCHILTEIAMKGNQSFASCAGSVGKCLSMNVSTAAVVHGTGWIVTIMGTLVVAAATSGCMVLGIVYELKIFKGADMTFFALSGAAVGGCVGYAFMSLLDRIAETLMYCYLRRKDDDMSPGAFWYQRIEQDSDEEEEEEEELEECANNEETLKERDDEEGESTNENDESEDEDEGLEDEDEEQ